MSDGAVKRWWQQMRGLTRRIDIVAQNDDLAPSCAERQVRKQGGR